MFHSDQCSVELHQCQNYYFESIKLITIKLSQLTDKSLAALSKNQGSNLQIFLYCISQPTKKITVCK